MERVAYLIRRVLEMILVVLVVAVLNFTLIHLAPGDVAVYMAGEEAGPEYISAIKHEYGLDLPLYVQLGKYMARLLHGDFGHSFTRGEPVVDIIIARMPATLLLMGSSLILGALVGTLGGALAARYVGSMVDYLISGLSVAAYSTPVFWLGLMLIYAFSVHLNWLPSSGMMSFLEEQRGIGDILLHMTLPVLSLTIYYVGQNIKVARASVAEAIQDDYITTFRAVGFKERTVFLKHALRNALLPIVSMTGLQFTQLTAGAVLTETVFSWPGMGQLMFQAVLARDYPLIMGGYILMSVMVVVFTLLVDFIYVALDPRIELK
jgi:peptide/nickel transport system permease protein